MPVNEKTSQLYTVGIWSVKEGKEKEFINAWTSFAKWTTKNVLGAGTGHLLQDETDAAKFISYGPWKDKDSITRWRESKEFSEFAEKVKILCNNFQPNTLREVSRSAE